MKATRHRISIAILALGGQGGGVLSHWIARLGAQNGYRSQATAVPGVAQRTGATVYYVEMVPWKLTDPDPILSLMPTEDDVDIVVALELMEAGRAMIRGLVSRARTTLITSTHRVYAISEKSARGNGIANAQTVMTAAAQRARRFIGFDMAAEAHRAGCAISAVIFGALAGSGSLPFRPAAYIEVMRADGKATDANLAGFAAGLQGSPNPDQTHPPLPADTASPTTDAGRGLEARIVAELPTAVYRMAIEGVRKLVDYQDYGYASLYLDRLAQIRGVDTASGGWKLTQEAARYLALWMAYEDTIRVSDLKVRDTRIARVRSEVGARAGQVVSITEFMHPRFRELCDTLPRAVGCRLLRSRIAKRLLAGFFSKGRFVQTTGLLGFVTLAFLASLRRVRRSTLRYAEEQALIEAWLQLARTAAPANLAAAVEIIRCQRLIKGYGDTHDQGRAAFDRIIAAYTGQRGEPDVASRLRGLREAALSSS